VCELSLSCPRQTTQRFSQHKSCAAGPDGKGGTAYPFFAHHPCRPPCRAWPLAVARANWVWGSSDQLHCRRPDSCCRGLPGLASPQEGIGLLPAAAAPRCRCCCSWRCFLLLLLLLLLLLPMLLPMLLLLQTHLAIPTRLPRRTCQSQ
jgi:hypothetical protein